MMRRNITANTLFLLVLALSGCAQNGDLDMQVDVNFTSKDGTDTVSIRNMATMPILLLDAGYSTELPDSIAVRIRRLNGDVLLNQAGDPDGWWRPAFLRSQLTLPEDNQYITLSSGDVISATFKFGNTTRGMRTTLVDPDESCEYQLRLDLQIEGILLDSYPFLSEWQQVDCGSALGT